MPSGYAATSQTGQVIVIDPSALAQQFQGFGTSLAWWANIIGQYPEPLRSNLVDLVFDKIKGLGLQLARYNIGGSGWNSPDAANFRFGANVPSFWGPDGEVDWEADAGQRWVLLAARERGACIFEAFSNSPPYWMTRSGRASGYFNSMEDNLEFSRYSQFAKYLAAVVAYYAREHGLYFRTLEPFNEPRTPYWWAGNVQEGCHFDLVSQNLLLPMLADALQKEGMSDVQIAASDETNIDIAVDTLLNYTPEALACISQINTHAYSGFGRADLWTAASARGKRVWMSEYGNGGSAPWEMGGALALSSTILADLNVMHASAWCYWQAVEDSEPAILASLLTVRPFWAWLMRILQILLLLWFKLGRVLSAVPIIMFQRGLPKRFFGTWWGLIQVPFRGGGEFAVTKQYWAMWQYSQFVRAGHTILKVDQPEWALAALSPGAPATRSATIVLTNAQEEVLTVNLDVSLLMKEWPGSVAYVQVYRTSDKEDGILLRTFSIPAAMSGFQFALHPQSITTFVVAGQNADEVLAKPTA
eukprot:jgi/Botrbrau1/21598/Bobra.43_1s0008.1